MSKFRLTHEGKRIVNGYIVCIKGKREKLLNDRARYDVDENDDTKLPTPEDILRDIEEEKEGTIFWNIPEGPCYRSAWPVTNTHVGPVLCLVLDEHFEIPDDDTASENVPEKNDDMRYMLASVTRSELDITESFYPTHKKAYDAMIQDILLSTAYNSEEELRSDAEKGKCELSNDGAWASSRQFGPCSWKIIELPAPQKVYVYKQYNDEYPYGEEDIQVFSNKDDATGELRKDVEAYFELPWKYIPFKLHKEWGEDAVEHFDHDNVVIDSDGDGTLHWIIEEKEIKKRK